MATIDSLANEILAKIMDMLKGPSAPGWEEATARLWRPSPGHYDALRAAALVCSRWRDPAQRALFDDVHLPWHGTPLRIQRLRDSPARARFRTRSMSAQQSCAGLEKLVIRETLDDQYGVEQQDRWDSTGWEVFAHPCFAGLTHLSIEYPGDFIDPGVIPLPPLQFRLSYLALSLCPGEYNYNIQGVWHALVAALFNASQDTMDTLHLRFGDADGETPVLPVFSVVAPNLLSINLESRNHDVFAGNTSIFAACTSLQRLALHDYHEKPKRPTCPLHLKAILDALPSVPTLKNLSLDAKLSETLEPLVPLLDHPALSLLDRLNIKVVGGDLEEEEEEQELSESAVLSVQQVCESRGIELTVKY
ncbi:hypothetical protein RQP46_011405 [Phenoliferia psychrophenolica]